MNRIDITEEGAQALDLYAESAKDAYQGIRGDTMELLRTLDSVSDGLGIIAPDLLAVVSAIKTIIDGTGDSVDGISRCLKLTANNIRVYIADKLSKEYENNHHR